MTRSVESDPATEGKKIVDKDLGKKLADQIIVKAKDDKEGRLEELAAAFAHSTVENEKKFLGISWLPFLPKERVIEIFCRDLRPSYLCGIYSKYFQWLLDLQTSPMIRLESRGEGSGGSYERKRGDGDIILNEKRFNEGLLLVVSTLAHEAWHDYQYECYFKTKEGDPNREYGSQSMKTLDNSMEPPKAPPKNATDEEIARYLKDVNAYKSQSHEKDAEYFAKEFCKVFEDKYKPQRKAARAKLKEARKLLEDMEKEKKRVGAGSHL